MSDGNTYLIKTVLMGDGAAGKTSLAEMSCEGNFSENYMQTVGVNFYIKEVELEGKKVSLQIWDLAGQNYYQVIRRIFYSGTEASILVFDLTREDTFKNLKNWLKEMYETPDMKPPIPMVLVGNKVDLEEKRKVKYPDGFNLAQSFSQDYNGYNLLGGIPYIETSAKNGKNVEDIFKKVAELYFLKESIG